MEATEAGQEQDMVLTTKCTLQTFLATLKSSRFIFEQGSNSYGTYLDVQIQNRAVRMFYNTSGQDLLGIQSYDKQGMEVFYREFVQKNRGLFSNLDDYDRKIQGDALVKRRIESLPFYRNPRLRDSPSEEKIRFVSQREGAFSIGRIETAGVGPCVVLIILNKETGEQFFCHIDGLTILDVAAMPQKIRSWGKTEAVLAGGLPSLSESTVAKALQFLDALKIKDISQYELMDIGLDGSRQFSSIAVKDPQGGHSLNISSDLRTNIQNIRIVEPPMTPSPLRIRQ